jgi:tetratricopeptide (TPR) repeat protein
MAVRVRVPLAAHTLLNKYKMQNKSFLFVTAISFLALTSCSKLGNLSSNNFTVIPTPLETQAGKVPVTINGVFPEKYMKKKAVVTVVPQLRYGNGQKTNGASATFQGEKVEGNEQTISYQTGGHYTMKTDFDYVPEMQKSDLYLTFNAKIGKRVVSIPDVQVANGVIATSELYKNTLNNASACIAPDSFKRINKLKQEANIKFLIQQANLRKSELKNNSVKEFLRLLSLINKDKEGKALDNIEVSAYASPDGGMALNDKLAKQRKSVSQNYVKGQLKTQKMTVPIDAKYTAEDWDGFQELVSASNVQDKDVILRVLSMYKDPEEREKQIHNISAAYRELADGILPQLRRSRLTVNYETIGRDDNQIQSQLASDPSKLSIEEMLYAATLKTDANEQEAIYKKTTEQYPNDFRAYNNVAVIEYSKGNIDEARNYIKKAINVSPKGAEANANLGLLALKSGNIQEAQNCIAKATGANGLNEVLGNLHLAQGNYAQAEEDFGDVNSNSSALAQILNKNYSSALVSLKYVKNPDAITEYLKAIVNARMGNKSEASTCLNNAVSKDPSLAKYAANDLELSKIK